MPRVPIGFVGPSEVSRSTSINDQLTMNLYPVVEGQGARSRMTLHPTPGLVPAFTAGAGPCRSQGVMFKGNLYFVSGDSLVSISPAFAVTVIGALGTSTGRCGIVAGRNYLMICDGVKGYSWNGAAYAQIVAAGFSVAPGYCCWQDGYFIVNTNGTDNWQISGPDDPTVWNALDFAVAQAKPDVAYRPESASGMVYLFGEFSTQAYYESGNALFPFDPIIPNGVFDYGCAAADSVAKMDERIFWLAKSERGTPVVVMIQGLNIQKISTPDIDFAIGNFPRVDDAQGWCYRELGHTFYVLTFPSSPSTYVYDVEQGMWHNRSSYLLGLWRPAGFGVIGSTLIVGDYATNQFYTMDYNTHTDNTLVIERIRRAPIISQQNRIITFNRLEVAFAAGVGLTSGQGEDPKAMLIWSDDGGHTWSNEILASIGKMGQYGTRAIWNALGWSYGRIFQVTVTDPVFCSIIDAFADIDVEDE